MLHIIKDLIYLLVSIVYFNYEKLGEHSHKLLGILYLLSFIISMVLLNSS